MKNYDDYFNAAETLWVEPIYSHLSKLYCDVHLPSHDLNHHLRVWANCKELFKELRAFGEEISQNFVEKSLVACLFHDTGLIIDKSERHGYQSRLICQHFFLQNPSLKIDGLEEILDAIEHHDDKTLKSDNSDVKASCKKLVTLVTSADDMDAWGLIGVFRYLEIYTLRGIAFHDIPDRVLTNLENRFANFEKCSSNYSNCYQRQKVRFLITYNFFKVIRQQIIEDQTELGENYTLAKFLINSLVEEKQDIKTMIAQGIMMGNSGNSINFFIDLKDELNL